MSVIRELNPKESHVVLYFAIYVRGWNPQVRCIHATAQDVVLAQARIQSIGFLEMHVRVARMKCKEYGRQPPAIKQVN